MGLVVIDHNIVRYGKNLPDYVDGVPWYFFEALPLSHLEVYPKEFRQPIVDQAKASMVKLEEAIQKSSDENWRAFKKSLCRIGSNAALQVIFERHEDIPKDHLRVFVDQFWPLANIVVGGPMKATSEKAINMLSKTGYFGKELEPGIVTIYHGIVFPEESGTPTKEWWDGMCWTTDIEVAERFANHGLFVAEVASSKVLASIERRSESELIVRLDDLQKIRRL